MYFWCGKHTETYIDTELTKAVARLNGIAVHGKSISEIWSVTCHMGSHSVTCHLTHVNVPRHNPSYTGQYSIYLHWRNGRKAELTLVLAIYRDGLPVRRQSPIQVLTT